MSFRSTVSWRWAATFIKVTAFAGVLIYVRHATRRVTAASRLGIKDKNLGLPSFTESETIRSYVNPKARGSKAVDMHTVTLRVPLNKGISDEAILAQASKNFFNGWVFYPEAKILSLVKLHDYKYSKLASTTVPSRIWDAGEMSETSLPELHTVLFGVFRLADVHLADAAKIGTATSHADFVFGSDMSSFAGCHRLSVERQETDEDTGTQKVKLQMQSYACNPQSDVPPGKIVLGFHRLYASVLFRETAGQVHRWLVPDEKSASTPWWNR